MCVGVGVTGLSVAQYKLMKILKHSSVMSCDLNVFIAMLKATVKLAESLKPTDAKWR